MFNQFRRRLTGWIGAAAAGALLVVALLVGASSPATAQVRVEDDAFEVGRAMLRNPAFLVGAEFIERSPGSTGVGTSRVSAMPTHSTSYGALTTGTLNMSGGAHSYSLGGDVVRGGARDATILRLDLNAPPTSTCLAFDFRFYTQEYPDFVGSSFNDAFVAELNESTWELDGSTLSAPRNFAFDPVGSPITVNAAGVTSVTKANAAGTTIGGATPLLSATTAITPGRHSLYLSLFDTGDWALDSVALIDNVRFLKTSDCSPGATVRDGRDYVALGDSYSSGFGVAPYLPGSFEDNGPNNCQRSRRAYSQLLGERFGLNTRLIACQGGIVSDLFDGRVRNPSWNEQPQLNHLRNETGLVTISIGGNDAGFSDVFAECVLGMELLPFNVCNGEEKVERPVREALSRLTGGTAGPSSIRSYDTIFSEIRRRSPHAVRIAVGYPEFYPEGGGDRTFLPGGRCEGVKKADQQWILQQIRKLNAAARVSALRNGFRFVDASSRFDGHELCGGGTEWIFPVSSAGRIHPTAEGHAAMADAIGVELNRGPSPYVVQPGQILEGPTYIIPLGKSKLTVVATWPGSDTPLTVISPSGVRYDRSNSHGADHEYGATWERFTVENPEPGEWRTEVYGADVDPDGEEVRFDHVAEDPPNIPPTARITYTKNADGTLMFSSATSTDDGQIVARNWYERTDLNDADPVPGETFTPERGWEVRSLSLEVVDDRGESDWATVSISEQPGGPGPSAPPAPPPVPPATNPGVTPGAAPGVAPPGAGPQVREGNGGPVVAPQRDVRAPRLSAFAVQQRKRTSARSAQTRWITTRVVKGPNARVQFRVDERARITIRAKVGRQARTLSFWMKPGQRRVPVRRVLARMPVGPATLTVIARDTSGNTSQKSVRVRLAR